MGVRFMFHGSGLADSYTAMQIHLISEVIASSTSSITLKAIQTKSTFPLPPKTIGHLKRNQKNESSQPAECQHRRSSIYVPRDLRPATPLLFTLPAETRHWSTIACLSSLSEMPCTLRRCGERLSQRILALSRHSGMGHLRPVSLLLCLLDVRKCRCRLDLASCRLPLNTLEHAGQLITVVGVAGAADVGEMESWDKVAGEVVWLLKLSVRGVSIDQDMILVGEEPRVLAPLYTRDEGDGLIIDWFRLIIWISLLLNELW